MIIVRLKGGLGNQMFQYAAGRSLAVRRRTSLRLDVDLLLDRSPDIPHTFREYHLGIFSISPRRASGEEVARFLKRAEPGGSLLDRISRRLSPVTSCTEPHFHSVDQFETLPRNTYLDGYWQSPRYFRRCESLIRADFRFKEPLALRSVPMMREIGECTSVCVHVRRGDYVGNPLHDVCGISYFEAALDIIRRELDRPRFFVFSDDPAWCVRHFTALDSTVVHSDGVEATAEEDFRLMCGCQHFIMSNSTFAWWAAWLSDRPGAIVITPTRWFGDPRNSTADLFPNHWRRLDNTMCDRDSESSV